MKSCIKCGEEKPLSEFYSNKYGKDGRRTDCKSCSNIERVKNYNPDKQKIYNDSRKEYSRQYQDNKMYWIKKYGITPEQYWKMYEQQNGLCKTCGNPETSVRSNGQIKLLSIDHCHRTGKIRGLLCQKCNSALGLVLENVKTLINMIDYIEENME